MRLIDADALIAKYGDWYCEEEGTVEGFVGDIKHLIDAQPTIEERKSGCEYCVTDTDGWVRPIEKNGHAFVWHNHFGWHVAVRARGWRGNAPINFCPMCGRELEGVES